MNFSQSFLMYCEPQVNSNSVRDTVRAFNLHKSTKAKVTKKRKMTETEWFFYSLIDRHHSTNMFTAGIPRNEFYVIRTERVLVISVLTDLCS
jgi:hypothetical protein